MPIDLAPKSAYGLALASPVLTAAGCFGYGVEYARLVDVGRIGAIVTRSTTLHGRRTAHPPRLIETPSGVLAVDDWPDPGVAAVVEHYAPVWAGWSTPVLLSVSGAAPDEYAAVARSLEGVEGVAGLELNVAALPGRAAAITAAVRAVTLLPLLVKLPPFTADVAALARAVVEAGADAITLIASPEGMAVDPSSGVLLRGRLSGPALRPLALLCVAEVAAAIDAPIVGCGGIATADDARQFLAAGAAVVQLGSALLADPTAAARIADQLRGDG